MARMIVGKDGEEIMGIGMKRRCEEWLRGEREGMDDEMIGNSEVKEMKGMDR